MLTLNCLGAAGAQEKRPPPHSVRRALNAQLQVRAVSDRLFNLLKRRHQQAPRLIFPLCALFGESSMADAEGGMHADAHLLRTAP